MKKQLNCKNCGKIITEVDEFGVLENGTVLCNDCVHNSEIVEKFKKQENNTDYTYKHGIYTDDFALLNEAGSEMHSKIETAVKPLILEMLKGGADRFEVEGMFAYTISTIISFQSICHRQKVKKNNNVQR